MGDFLRKQTGIDLPSLSPGSSLIDYDVQVASGEWIAWQTRVPVIEIEAHSVTRRMSLSQPWILFDTRRFCTRGCLNTKPLMLCGHRVPVKLCTIQCPSKAS